MAKRGPKAAKGYPIVGRHKLSAEITDLIARRTEPFLDHVGIHRPIAVLLREAYLQGVKDTLDTLEHLDDAQGGAHGNQHPEAERPDPYPRSRSA